MPSRRRAAAPAPARTASPPATGAKRAKSSTAPSDDVAQLRAALGAATAAQADLERFVYLCSHDLREPLRMVTGFLGLLDRRGAGLTTQQREYLDLALGGASRLDGMLEALLGYSRCGRERHPGPVALQEVVAECRQRVASAHPELSVAWEQDPLPEVWGDRTQLQTLHFELLNNAVIYHASDQPPQVRITVTRLAAAWRLAVADRGIGIPAGDRTRALEVFQRLHPTGAYPGHGMGLALCKKIVDQHQGQMTIDDNVPAAGHVRGEGTIITVTLPDRSA